jgi:hypothetical protein
MVANVSSEVSPDRHEPNSFMQSVGLCVALLVGMLRLARLYIDQTTIGFDRAYIRCMIPVCAVSESPDLSHYCEK